MMNKEEELKRRYDSIALTGDENTTACDFNLRDLEINLGLEYIREGDAVLDVGCGPGVALRRYAARSRREVFGIDYSANMIAFARRKFTELAPGAAADLRCASVEKLPFDDGLFDVVTSHRCLMALLDWERQKTALGEIHRVLKEGGIFVMMEGTFDGLERLNFYRRKFGLEEIDAGGNDRLLTLKFHEKELTDYGSHYFDLVRTQRFGMYYFLTRIVNPLLVAPDKPSYDHPLNALAKTIAAVVPDFESLGHLVGFVWRKKSARGGAAA